MLHIVLLCNKIIFSYNIAPLFNFAMDKGQAAALCWLCNKRLGGGKKEYVAFPGLLTEQLKTQ